LPPETLLVMADPAGITATIALAWERITANQAEAAAHREPALAPERIFLSGSELAGQLDRFALLQLHDFPAGPPTEAELPPDETHFTLIKPTPAADVYPITCGNHTLLRQELELQRRKSGLLAPLAERISHWLKEGERVAIACRSGRHAEQLGEFLGQHGLITQPAEPPLATARTTAVVSLYSTPITAGFDLPTEGLHLLSETELFGEKRLSRRKVQGPPPGEAISFEELKGGDIVVHRTHGLASYAGLINMTVNGIPGDYLQLLFHGDDKLYVPVDRLNIVHKYQGLSDQKPSLDRLGGKGWLAAKEKVKEAVWKVAQELLDLYARRQLAQGRRFSGPDELYQELEES
ncbi:MAG TPA: CarD family transcriptional regulator, partial [Desulfurivibrionaceae bacterium]|nr:CarD family transcriptional regulator [Desulfurivibrionaceae bacterium]